MWIKTTGFLREGRVLPWETRPPASWVIRLNEKNSANVLLLHVYQHQCMMGSALTGCGPGTQILMSVLGMDCAQSPRELGVANMKSSHTRYLGFEESGKDQLVSKEGRGRTFSMKSHYYKLCCSLSTFQSGQHAIAEWVWEQLTRVSSLC